MFYTNPAKAYQDARGANNQSGVEGLALKHILQDFDISAVTENLRRDGFEVEQWLTHMWHDGEDFLAKRCRLTEKLGIPSNEHNSWSKRLGLDVNQPDENIVQLYWSVIVDGKWPPLICDLFKETTVTLEVFPSPNSTSIISLSRTQFSYIVSIQDGVACP